jgi:hypothetical protein
VFLQPHQADKLLFLNQEYLIPLWEETSYKNSASFMRQILNTCQAFIIAPDRKGEEPAF